MKFISTLYTVVTQGVPILKLPASTLVDETKLICTNAFIILYHLLQLFNSGGWVHVKYMLFTSCNTLEKNDHTMMCTKT